MESINQANYPNYEVIIVDNGSTDDSVKKIEEYAEGKRKAKSKFFEYNPDTKPLSYNEYYRRALKKKSLDKNQEEDIVIIRNENNLGFSRGNNVGIKYALKFSNPDYVLLLNNDMIVRNDFLSSPIRHMEKHPEIGIATGKIHYYSKPSQIWAAGGQINILLGITGGISSIREETKFKEVDYAPGAMMLIRKSIFQKIGLLPKHYFAGGGESEFSIKARKIGYKVICDPNSVAYHKVGITSGQSTAFRYCYWRTRLALLEENLPKVIWKFWLPIFLIIASARIFKEGENLKILNHALKDFKEKNLIEEEDLIKAEKVLN